MAAGCIIKQTLFQFSRLHKAFIDTSSLLYMEKCGLLGLLSGSIALYVVPGVCREYGPGLLPFTVYHPVSAAKSTDLALFAACSETGLPIVSEDKGLLKRAARAGLEYYNSLMMLAFLFHQQVIAGAECSAYLAKLDTFARYGQSIRDYGAAVLREIQVKHRSGAAYNYTCSHKACTAGGSQPGSDVCAWRQL